MPPRFGKSLIARLFIAMGVAAALTLAEQNYSFAVFWPRVGVADDLSALYRELFEPGLRRACPAAVGVKFTFEEFLLPKWPSMELIEFYARRLSNSSFLFAAAAENDAKIGQILRSAAPDSLRWHSSVASPTAPPMQQLAQGLALTALSTVSDAPFPAVALIVGPPYRAPDLAPLFAAASVDCHQLEADGNNSASVVHRLLHPFRPGRLLVLAASRRLMVRILQLASGTSLGAPEQRWLLFDTGQAVLSQKSSSNTSWQLPFANEADNITSMEFGPYTEQLAAHLPTTEHVMLHDLLAVWTELVRQLVCGNGTQWEERNLTGLTGTFRLLRDRTVTRENWRLGIYRNLPIRPELVGEFTTDGRFSLTPQRQPDNSREAILRHYRKAPLKVLFVLDDLYVRLKPGNLTKQPLEDRLEGLAFDLCMRLLRQNLGLTNLSLELLPDAEAVNNAVWLRVAEALEDGRAELACSAMPRPWGRLSRQLAGSVALTRAYLSTNLSVLFREVPAEQVEAMFHFVSAMHWQVWLAALGSACLLALTMSGLHRCHPHRSQFHAVYTVYAALAELLFRGRRRQPKRLSGRFALSAFRLAALLLLAAFAANLAGQRCLARVQVPIGRSLTSLLDQSAYRFGTLANSSYSAYFKESPFPRMRAIYERMQRRGGLFESARAGLAAVEAGDFAMIYDARRNAYWSGRICHSRLIVFNDIPIELGLALPVGSKLLPLLNEELTAAVANRTQGWLGQLERRYFDSDVYERPTCNDSGSGIGDLLSRLALEEPPSLAPRPGALTLRDTLGLALLNLLSCVLVLLVAALEYTFDRCRSRWGRNLLDREDSIRSSFTDRRRSTLVLMPVDEIML